MPKARVIPPRFKIPTKKNIRKHLCKDAQLSALRSGFELIPDHRCGVSKISLPDVLMSGFAVFDLKDPSLLAFDNRRTPNDGNMERIYGVTKIACDTQMRTVLDPVNPELLRANFRTVTAQLQRSKALQQFTFYKGCYCSAWMEPVHIVPTRSLRMPAWLRITKTVPRHIISRYLELCWFILTTRWLFLWHQR